MPIEDYINHAYRLAEEASDNVCRHEWQAAYQGFFKAIVLMKALGPFVPADDAGMMAFWEGKAAACELAAQGDKRVHKIDMFTGRMGIIVVDSNETTLMTYSKANLN